MEVRQRLFSTEVVGSVTFMGQAATQFTTIAYSRFQLGAGATGGTSSFETKTDAYLQLQPNSFWRELGFRIEDRQSTGVPGQPTQVTITQTMSDPGLPSTPFGLGVGQSLTLSTAANLRFFMQMTRCMSDSN